MSFADLPPGTHAKSVRSHWWTRPGWSSGRSFYTWHLTFDGAHALHSLVREYQQAIDTVGGLSLVPMEGLHLTMQGVGFTDEVPQSQLEQVINSVESALPEVAAIELAFRSAIVADEAIVLPPEKSEGVILIRSAVRESVAKICGHEDLPDPRFRPHVSMAYVNRDGPSGPYIDALESVRPETVVVPIHHVSLISLRREERKYRWDVVTTVPLGPIGNANHVGD